MNNNEETVANFIVTPLYYIAIFTVTFIIYIAIGSVISVPYAYLAGNKNLWPTLPTIFSPIILLILFILYMTPEGGRNKTIIYTLFTLILPVLTNLISKILITNNFIIGNIVYEQRYLSIPIFILLSLIFSMIFKFIKKMKGA